MERWSGKVALVTGASAGIGAAIAVELAKHGLKVVAVARGLDKLEGIKAGLGSVKGEFFPLVGDVSKEEDIKRNVRWIRERFGAIHVLVNNAGIFRYGSLISGEPEHWQQVMDVNVLGRCFLIQEVYKLMKDAGVDDGHIIHMNSISGHKVPNFGRPTSNIYAASKHAVTALTETLRQELRFFKSNIRVTSISPGIVETGIWETSSIASIGEYPEAFRNIIQQQPALKSQDIADAVIYVLSTPAHVQVHELIIKPVGERV